jgi:hypothetical protein
VAVGRKRWLLLGHPDAGWRGAVICSIIVSCRRRGINPQDPRTDVLAWLTSLKVSQIGEFLPAKLLALMGLDHERLTYHYAGRDFRPPDVRDIVAREIMA